MYYFRFIPFKIVFIHKITNKTMCESQVNNKFENSERNDTTMFVLFQVESKRQWLLCKRQFMNYQNKMVGLKHHFQIFLESEQSQKVAKSIIGSVRYKKKFSFPLIKQISNAKD